MRRPDARTGTNVMSQAQDAAGGVRTRDASRARSRGCVRRCGARACRGELTRGIGEIPVPTNSENEAGSSVSERPWT